MRRFAVLWILLLLCMLVMLPVSAQQPAFQGYLVKLTDEAPRLLSSPGLEDYVVVDTLEEALELPEAFVEYIEPNYLVYLFEDTLPEITPAEDNTTGEATPGDSTTGGEETVPDEEPVWPSDPLYADEQWSLQAINGLAACEAQLTGKGVLVGMVDSGVHAAHEDLQAKNISGINYVDDGMTYAEDVYGHGTVVAGVIAANTNNGLGVAGIVPDVQLRAYRCFNSRTAYMSEVLPGIQQAVADGCQVINLSLGTPYDLKSLREEVLKAVEAGAVVVAAAGNDGTAALQYPAAYPGVIGVGSVDERLKVSSFSQHNESVFVTAPGEKLVGLHNSEPTGYQNNLSGTSYAAPVVSAMAAAALDYDSDITADGIRYLLQASSSDLGDDGYDTDYGWGLVDVEAFLTELQREFFISYELNGGSLWRTRARAVPESYFVTDDDITLPVPVREDYRFTGWYADQDLTQRMETIPAGSVGDKILYAGWEKLPSISILGDSISTFTNWSSGAAAETTNSTIASGAVYYSAGTHGVYQTDTWWQQTADRLGLRLLVNNSWSGSCVLNTRSETEGAWVERCVQLHDDTGENAGEEPDIIAVFLGTNDFSYYQSQLGTADDIDYTTLITAGEDGFVYATPSTVCEAYAVMLHKMTNRYPDAEVYCMTMLPRRADAAVGQPEEFNDSIRAIAERFGCYVADLYEDCGIPSGNDSFDHYFPDQRVHPNCFGMDAITGTLVSSILENTACLPDDRVLHSVSYDLNDVLVDQGTAKTLQDGMDFSVSFTVPEGRELEVTVTMNRRDITDDCYTDGVITIGNVTGDLSITAVAVRPDHEPSTYRWVFDGRDFASVTSGGQRENTLSRLAGTVTDGVFSGTRYALAQPVHLRYDEPWIVEWRCEGSWQDNTYGGMLLAGAEASTDAAYLYKRSGNGLVAFGQYSGSTYHNYGIPIADYDLDPNTLHTYRIENRIAADGSNMPWLLVDGVEIGPMNRHFISGDQEQPDTADWLCGRDLVFTHMGTTGHKIGNCSIDYIQVWEGGLPDYSGKVISVLGDSISTFAGYIPVADGFNLEHLARYPQDDLLTDVNETWWMQVIDGLDAKLGINDSWRGATVSGAVPVTTGTTGEKAAMSNLTRIRNLGSNGTPDVILFYGGTNDLAHVSKVGTFDSAIAPAVVDLTTTSWDNLAEAYAHTLLRLRHFYPDATIVAMLPTYTKTYYSNAKLAQANAVLTQICAHYNIPCVDLQDCGITADHLPDGIHPGEEGMDLISAAVIDALLGCGSVEAGEHVVYPVTHTLQQVSASLGHYKGIDAGVSFTEVLTANGEMEITVTMNGRDITEDCYEDGVIRIDRVTGPLSVTAQALFSLEGHLQALPDPVYRETNLWTALEPENGYFMGADWSTNYRSITFAVSAGDQIYANAFGAAGENGGTQNGIRVTFFDPYGVNKTMIPAETYAEYQANGGYVVAPEGTVAVNVVLWKDNKESEVRVLNWPHGIHDEQSVVTPPTCTEQGYTTHTCTVCGDTYTSAYTDPVEHVFSHYDLYDPVNGTATAVCAFGCGASDEKTVHEAANWQLGDQGVAGEEYGPGIILLALYDAHHRMVAADFCIASYHTTVGSTIIYRCTAPDFSQEALAEASYLIRYSLNTVGTYAPVLEKAIFAEGRR